MPSLQSLQPKDLVAIPWRARLCRGAGLPASCMALLVLLFVIAPASCQSVASPDEEVLVFEIAPQTVTCQGEGVHECLRVREPPEAEWRNFFGSIEGFTHETGHRYLIRVARRRVANPPADGSSFEYRLLEVLEDEPVGG